MLLQQSFEINYQYPVFFSEDIFNIKNNTFSEVFKQVAVSRKALVLIENNVFSNYSNLASTIKQYFEINLSNLELVSVETLEGGEVCKNDKYAVEKVLVLVNDFKIDRHSFIIAIGGGAFIDMIGYSATIAHRGINLVRVPTTVLAQNDAAIGVKNSVNFLGKKNFLGTFSIPFAVVNDANFLITLDDRDWRAGMAEAVKVALIKDKTFFEEIEADAILLSNRNLEAMKKQIYKCADLHLQHIRSKDPFERGSSRPLDYGHWSAHKLEQMSNFTIRHGEAVAIGMALDAVYSHMNGYLSKNNLEWIIRLLKALGFQLFSEFIEVKSEDNQYIILKGLQEFQEHLGGQLTIMLLKDIGTGIEVNEIDNKLMAKAIDTLKTLA